MQSALAQRSADPIARHAEVLRLQDCLAESERRRAEHEQAIEEHERQIQPLRDDITRLKRQRCGPSADRRSPDQLQLFDEAELEALIAALEIAAELPAAVTPRQPAPAPPKDPPVRRPWPEHLPRVARLIDLPEAQQQAMGSDWTVIGYDASEQLAVSPRQPEVILFKRAQYVPLNEDVVGAAPGVSSPRGPRRSCPSPSPTAP